MNGLADYGCPVQKRAKPKRQTKRPEQKPLRAGGSNVRKTIKVRGFGDGTVLDRRWTKLL
jgi:hypothetical protein